MVTKNSAWHDSMYNNRELVPNFADHFSDWIDGSKAARANLTCHLDIAYGKGPNETLDIFPAQKANAPVVVFIHGGYWRSLDKADHSFVAAPLHEMGACVVVVNYALCPGTPNEPVTIPDIAVQMTHALAWVWQNIAKHGGNPKDVVVAGHSAGGHLAAMLLACDWKSVDKTIPAHWIQKSLSISLTKVYLLLCQNWKPQNSIGYFLFLHYIIRARFIQCKQATQMHHGNHHILIEYHQLFFE